LIAVSDDRRQFSTLQLRPAGWEDYVEIWVDCERLIDRLIEAQQRANAHFILKDPGLGWSYVEGDTETAFDTSLRESSDSRDRLLTVCEGCNEFGCGDTFVKVAVEGTIVEFHNFSTQFLWLDLPAIRFEASQFFGEVDRLHDWYVAQFRPTP
jgi:hypothetical protein